MGVVSDLRDVHMPVLLPVIDLCNHRRGGEHNCAIVFEDDAQTTLTSPRHARTPVYLT